MNGRLRLSRPISVKRNLAFSQHPTMRKDELYLSHAVLLGGKMFATIYCSTSTARGLLGVTMAPLLHPERRPIRPVDYRVVRGARWLLLLAHSRGKLPFLAPGPRLWALRHRPYQVRLLPNCEPPL
jgi:hypothetical protein